MCFKPQSVSEMKGPQFLCRPLSGGFANFFASFPFPASVSTPDNRFARSGEYSDDMTPAGSFADAELSKQHFSAIVVPLAALHTSDIEHGLQGTVVSLAERAARISSAVLLNKISASAYRPRIRRYLATAPFAASIREIL